MAQYDNTIFESTAERNQIRAQKDAAAQLLDAKNLGLTKRKFLFCREYIRDMDAERAALAAGYKKTSAKRTAYTLLNEPKIVAAINSLLEERAQKEKLTQKLVINAFLRIAKKAEEQEQWSAALRAWEDLARYLGMFVDKTESTISVDARTGGSDEENMKEIKRMMQTAKSRQLVKTAANG